MRDFNFFDELKQKKKAKTSPSTYVTAVVLLLGLVLGGVTYIYLTELDALESEKAMLESRLIEGAHKESYDEVLAINEQLLTVVAEKEEIEVIHGRLLDSRIIDNLLIKEIAIAKPEALAITSISFAKEGINIAGTSINKDLIARFEHNLRANKRFSGSFIPVIEKLDKWKYTFTMSISFSESVIPIEEEVAANGEG